MTRRDRFRGSLVGLAVGDAVGTTVEFMPPGTFAPVRDMVGGGPFALPPGAWTDDTSMALCLAESLVERGTFDPVDQLERYVRWYREGRWSSTGRCFDIGNATRAALERFERTGEPFPGDAAPDAAGNGPLMKLAPVALAYASAPADAIRFAGESARTTHGAAEAVDATRAFAALLIAALNGTWSPAGSDAGGARESTAPDGAGETAASRRADEAAAAHSAGGADESTTPGGADETAASSRTDEAAAGAGETAAARRAGAAPRHVDPAGVVAATLGPDAFAGLDARVVAALRSTREPPAVRGGGYVIDALEAALWALRTTTDFEAGVLAAVNLGDDADTTAAIYGQLAGALFGLKGIPERWRERVHQHDAIVGFADALYDLDSVRR